jgi:hypothetical protein
MSHDNIVITSKTASKKTKLELGDCGICMNKYTAIIRKKCICKYCNADSCSKCIEQYLLGRHEDAHCLHCRVNYTDSALQEICTKTYLQHTYFKHRQEVLINRERANLPGLQDIAIDERRKRDNNAKICDFKKEIVILDNERDIIMTEYNTLYTEYYTKLATKQDYSSIRKQLDELLVKSDAIRTQIADKRESINRIRWPEAYGLPSNGNTKPEEEKKKFIRRCTRENCQGFLSTAWKCGICEYYSCSKCFVTKTKKQDDPHECKKEDVETAEMIKKDSKPCPNCGEFIMKSSGCFAKDTPILLWNGSTKMSQDISIGDKLVGDDGTKRTVLDTTTGIDTMYEVKQSLGMTYVVNSKHTLVLKYNTTMTVNDAIMDTLYKYKMSDSYYHILVDDYIQLKDDIKNVLVGCKIVNNTIIESSIQVSELGLGEYFGWKVDCNSKFLLNDFTSVSNCSQMFCISCQTPWDWNTGKVVTNGIIHNPHYYEWMKRNGGSAPRNPADVPCGGYPNVWELRRMPKGMLYSTSNIFFDFHRLCQELQDISERNYRSHIDQDSTNSINVKFLLGDFDEKHWGQLLGKNERRRKRDKEVQEIFAAFRMVAVELINRVQNYRSDTNRTFTELPLKEAELFMENLDIEIKALIKMINDALYNASISYCYSVPYIYLDEIYYSIKTKNFSEEVKKKKGDKTNTDIGSITNTNTNIVVNNDSIKPNRSALDIEDSSRELSDGEDSDGELYDEDTALQVAIVASLEN